MTHYKSIYTDKVLFQKSIFVNFTVRAILLEEKTKASLQECHYIVRNVNIFSRILAVVAQKML